jgi:hypothetical protein
VLATALMTGQQRRLRTAAVPVAPTRPERVSGTSAVRTG